MRKLRKLFLTNVLWFCFIFFFLNPSIYLFFFLVFSKFLACLHLPVKTLKLPVAVGFGMNRTKAL